MTDDDDLDDLSQFHGVFYEEADEHLAAMESLLLGLDLVAPDGEQLNAIFRAAHSIKGGAAVFDFVDITSLTHEMETVFDRVRKGEVALSTRLIDAFLAAGDALQGMFAHRRGVGDAPSDADVAALCEHLRSLLEPVADAQPPVAAPLRGAHDATPVAPAVDPAPLPSPHRDATAQRAAAAPADDDAFGFFVDPSTLPNANANAEARVVALPQAVDRPAERPVDKPAAKTAKAGAGDDAASIRVSVGKVDQLINLVGELVITQAMLAQAASEPDAAQREALANAISQLQRNTRDVQEAAMSMRMMPMSSVFSRFPRMVRDVAAKLSKEVDLVTIGETTELDKGLIERIVDPLTHLVRNSLDHGIEPPDERVAKGKSSRASITMRAFHQGGAIVIEVSDDGRGLSRDRILAKARERGMTVSDTMADQEVWSLIFEAGFSTAATVTDVSGRGVGMDVVRRNIQEMGGRVEIESVWNAGTRMRIKLPLTLAILDGMSVRVEDELFIIPLNYISESLQPKDSVIHTVGGTSEVIRARGEFLPVLPLAQVLSMPVAAPRSVDGIIVIVEAEGGKTALRVDALVGQHQVVIKSLETNYRKVDGISGATIMGDGRVAMILDVPHIVATSRQRLDKAA